MLAVPVDHNGVGGATPAAQAAENALVDINILLPPVIGMKVRFLFGHMSVAGPLNRFLKRVFVMVNDLVCLSHHLSVRRIQGRE